MLQIFNYNSRSFTILAVILLGVLAYSSYKSNQSSQIPVQENPAGARYVMEVDPSNPDKTLFEKAILFFFKKDIDKKLEQGKQAPSAPTFFKQNENTPASKVGDRVTIIYYQTNPMPVFLPSSEDVIIGNNKLPKIVDEMLIGMKVGEKREFKAGGIHYHIELVDIPRPAEERL